MVYFGKVNSKKIGCKYYFDTLKKKWKDCGW